MRISEIRARVGQTRFYALVALFVLVVALGAGWQEWFMPQFEKLTREKNTAESERARLQQDIIDLPAKYEGLKKNEARYEELLAHGFTKPQDRIAARQSLDELRNTAGLRGIEYNILPQEILKSDDGFAMTDQMVKSGITVSFKALTDIEVRNFVEEMQNHFNGRVVLKSFDMARKDKLDEANLLKLSQKTPVDFIEGKASFDWYSLVPKASDAGSAATQAFGGVSQ